MTPLEWVKNIISACAAGIDRENEQRTQDDAEKLAEIYENYNIEQQESVHQILREQFQMNDALYILSFLAKYLNLDAFWEDIIWHVCRENKDCFLGSMVEGSWRSMERRRISKSACCTEIMSGILCRR